MSTSHRPRFNSRVAPALALALLACGCGELSRLREENERLRDELAALRASGGATPIPELTIGIVGADETGAGRSGKRSPSDFDSSAFRELVTTSLEDASIAEDGVSIRVAGGEGELEKIRGLLVQHYMSEGRVPIVISNLTYKVDGPRDEFVIGGTVVPLDGITVEATGSAGGPIPASATPADESGLVRCTYPGELPGFISRRSDGSYAVEYRGPRGQGEIPVELDDAGLLGTLFAREDGQQVARQGDMSFTWQPRPDRILVLRVDGFRGDLGRFLASMRYPRSRIELNQYQTIRDAVLLFGYGPYNTGLVQEIETPLYIDTVEVIAVDTTAFDALEPGLPPEELEAAIAALEGSWTRCDFLESSATGKSWERPVDVQVPFLSRQISKERGNVFYTKYGVDGPELIGDFPGR